VTTDPHQIDHVTQELAAREPIFHRPELGTTRSDYTQMMAEDFWEVGASGRIYSRENVLDILMGRRSLQMPEHLVVTDFVCRYISANIYLVTYQLEQDGGRLSRRSTLWQRTTDGWKIRYHQGTLISVL
jgi:hypothetical protein